MSRAHKVVDYIQKLEKKLRRDLIIVETGTIRNTDPKYEDGDGWSTLYICKYLAESDFNHKFFSIDLDTSVAGPFLEKQGVREYVTLLAEHSLNVLPTFNTIDLAYLDSANNADLILGEFKIVEKVLTPAGIVLVDDVYMDSHEIFKGHRVVPYAKTQYDVIIENGMAIIRGKS